MSAIPQQFKLTFAPIAKREATLRSGNARFTVLTDRLIRLEYHPQACFEDRPSQAFWFREQPVPEFTVNTTAHGLEIETEFLHLIYHDPAESGFTADTLTIKVKSSETVWHFGDTDTANLGGTTRTLDFVNGYTPLEPGLMSRAGWSILDDSATLLFNEEGWLEPRIAGGIDLYFLGYGHDYKACLQDYCRISGKSPMIPRWVLGNWWSRYWHYTQEECVELIQNFERYQLPFSVFILDMDWHITKTGNTSTGWTGYTWNKELFPDPQDFLDFAHEKHLRISMNLHPAEGIHPHEAQYEEIAQRLGLDTTSGQPVAFNIADPAFATAYFEVLHHPYEKMGVDFWWLDWQQGQKSTLAGLDPLWLINHLHFYDLGRDQLRRPFIFSRWGNEGHQRYPIGFSGDSYATWDTLSFQSYMTATATNIAYGWWSHDIGGHTSGIQDSELFTRWVQFGIFSPINRIHVTKGLFYDRRPWAFEDADVLRVLQETLQLRHALIPYLYTMAWRAHEESLPLVQPMYYDYPEDEQAYHCPHQYLFGTELIAAPFVAPADADTGLSRQVVWLPQGDWYHFFTGEYFAGDSWHAIYGKLGDIPIFARAGAIVPLAANVKNDVTLTPAELGIHIFAGADNHFILYEDDGETNDYQQDRHCTTKFTQTWTDDLLNFTIDRPQGDTSLIPEQRLFSLIVHGVTEDVHIVAQVDRKDVSYTTEYDSVKETLHIKGLHVGSEQSLSLSLETSAERLLSRRDRKAETLSRLLRFFKLNTAVRNAIGDRLETIIANPEEIAPYLLGMTNAQARALFEVLYDAGVHHLHDTNHANEIVLWNNQENPQITYRYGDIYLFFGSVQSAHHDNGIVPHFKAFIVPENSWTHGALQEHVHTTHWHTQIDYDNLLTVSESHREVSP